MLKLKVNDTDVEVEEGLTVLQACEKAGVEFDQKIVYGNPGYEITKFANMSRNKIDMVVIGSRGRSSAKELFFGSTSQFVLHKSKPSVLIIK